MSEEIRDYCHHKADCGCVIEVCVNWHEQEVDTPKIVEPCPKHGCRPEPAAAEAGAGELTHEGGRYRFSPLVAQAITEGMEGLVVQWEEVGEKRMAALEARITALEQLTTSAPRAGDGYREIPAGERGEGEA